MKIGKAVKWMLLLGLVVALATGAGLSQAQEPPPSEGEVQPQGGVSIAATVSSKISYQGVLKENGQPVTGSRDMTFRLYSDDTCSTQVGSDIVKSGVQVTDGLFSVDLDVTHGDFNGQGLWLEVEVGGTKIGCQEILPVPYALSLRPGASVEGEIIGWNAIYAKNTASSGYSYGVRAISDSPDGRGVSGENWGGGIGVYGYSDSGPGMAAYGGSTDAPDLILGANSSTYDNGTISSDPSYASSDIVLLSNDNVRIDLDDDGDGEDADFEIYDKDDNRIFNVDDSGDVFQPLTADGLVKAAVYADCRSSGSTIHRHFNNVNGVAITISDGTSSGRCTIDFNFDLSNRYWIAMPAYTGYARTIGCELNSDSQKLDCARFDENGNGTDGNIMVIIY